MDRPKRYVAKPQRYQTTSSDEAPQKKVVQKAQVDIEDDAEEIRRILEDKECDIHNSVISYPQMHSQSHMQPQTHSQPQMYSQSHTLLQPHMQSQPHTFSQPHTQSQPLMPSQLLMRSQSRTHSQPNMPSQQHMDSLPHTYLQEHVDSQPDIHSQAHTQSQPYAQNELQLIHYAAEIGGTNVNADLQSIMERMHNEQIENRRILQRIEQQQVQTCTDNKRILSLVQNIAKCVQHNHSAVRKPGCLPITSIVQMDAFEELDENEYSNVVQYLCNIGGFNVKEAITLCLKESIIDSMTLSYTWWGHKGHKPLYDTRLVMAIFDAVCKNPYFTKPSRQEFQRNVIEALRAAKERVRSKKRGSRRPAAQENIARNFWKDRADADDADLTDEN